MNENAADKNGYAHRVTIAVALVMAQIPSMSCHAKSTGKAEAHRLLVEHYQQYAKVESPKGTRGGRFRSCIFSLGILIEQHGVQLTKKDILTVFGKPDFAIPGKSQVWVYTITLSGQGQGRKGFGMIRIGPTGKATGAGINAQSAIPAASLKQYSGKAPPLKTSNGLKVIRSM